MPSVKIGQKKGATGFENTVVYGIIVFWNEVIERARITGIWRQSAHDERIWQFVFSGGIDRDPAAVAGWRNQGDAGG